MPKLTDRYLTALKLTEGQRDRLVFDVACPGLGVRLTKAGTRVFIVQWTDPATKRKVREPLGVWGGITIDQARDAARVRLGTVAKGINPKAERLAARAEADRLRAELALTFDALVTGWVTLHLSERRPRYAAEAERAIRHAFANLMKRPAARITKGDARAALDKLVSAGKTAMAGGHWPMRGPHSDGPKSAGWFRPTRFRACPYPPPPRRGTGRFPTSSLPRSGRRPAPWGIRSDP
jgi:hypothetical protein